MSTIPHSQPPGGPPSAPTTPVRPWYRKKRVLVPAGLILLVGLGGALTDSEDTTAPTAAPTTSSATQEPAASTSQAASSAPVSQSPSATPSTSSSPEITSTQAEVPETFETVAAPVIDPYSERFGTFDTVSESGTGDAVMALPQEAQGALVTASHEGNSNFAVKTLDASNEMDELLVNEIGVYSGTVPYGLMGDTPGMLQITADGRWTVEIAPISSAPLAGASTSGTGDAVHKYEGPAAVASVTHDGDSNFALHQTDGTWPDLLINEIGQYEGSVPLVAGPSLLIVSADGAWTIATS